MGTPETGFIILGAVAAAFFNSLAVLFGFLAVRERDKGRTTRHQRSLEKVTPGSIFATTADGAVIVLGPVPAEPDTTPPDPPKAEPVPTPRPALPTPHT